MTTMTMSMFGTALPARWEAKGSLLGPVPERVRMHWYADGGEHSACGNYRRESFMAITWAADQTQCPRCAEAFTFAGRHAPPMPEPPSDDPENDEDDDA